MPTRRCHIGKCTVLQNGNHTGPGCGCLCHEFNNGKSLEERIINLETIISEILSVFESMPEVGNWRLEKLREVVKK